MRKLTLVFLLLGNYLFSQYNVRSVPYFYQYNNYINPGGSCQNTSIAMLLKFYGATTVTPDDISDIYGTSQAQSVSGFNTVCNAVAQDYNLGSGCVSTSTGSFQGLRNLLAQGKPVVVHGYFTNYGHVMIVTGYTSTTYICNDPAGRWSQQYQYGGYCQCSSTEGKQIQYSKSAFEQAIGPDNTLWYHYFNTQPCSVPTGLYTLDVTTNSAKLKWAQVTNASSYNVRYRKTGTTSWFTANTYYNELNVSSLQSNSSYEFQVQTKCGGTLSAFSGSNTFNTLLPPCNVPSNLVSSSITHNSANVSWTGSSGTTNYTIRYKPTSSATWLSITSTSTSSSISGLNALTQYEFQVQSNCSSSSNSVFSASSNFTTLATPCNVPTNLSSSSITHNSASLSWTSVTGVSGYTLRYKPTSSTTWLTLTSSTNTSNITNLSSSTSYEFQVQSNCSSSSNSVFSTSSNFTTLAPPCNAPTNLNSSSITHNSATVSWNAVNGVTNFTVRYKPTSNTTWQNVTSTTTSVNLINLLSNTSYEFQVQSNCGTNSNSVFTASNNFTTLIQPCNPPSNLASSSVTHNSANVSWTSISGVTNYTVRYKTTSNTTWLTLSSTINSANLTGLSASTPYEFQVQSNCSSSSNSVFSTSSNFTTLAPPCNAPTNLVTSVITSNSATISWTGNSGASGYNIKYRLSGSTTWVNLTSTSTQVNLTGLSANSLYEYQIQSNCNVNQSNFVSSSFTTLSVTPVTLQIGNGTTNYSGHPYSSSYMDEKSQYIITKNDLLAAGWSSQTPVLQSIAFQVSTPSSTTLSNFTIRVSHTSASTYSNSSFLAGTTTSSTYTGSIVTTSGWNTYTFSTPFNYNETMNLVITVSFNNSIVGTNSIVSSTILPDYKALFVRDNLSSSGISSTATGTQSYYRPNMRLKFAPLANANLRIGFDDEEEINTVLEKSNLFVFPNPMNSSSSIHFSTDLNTNELASVKVIDITGRIIYESNLVLTNDKNIIELQKTLDAGLYFLYVATPNQKLTNRFIVNQ